MHIHPYIYFCHLFIYIYYCNNSNRRELIFRFVPKYNYLQIITLYII